MELNRHAPVMRPGRGRHSVAFYDFSETPPWKTNRPGAGRLDFLCRSILLLDLLFQQHQADQPEPTSQYTSEFDVTWISRLYPVYLHGYEMIKHERTAARYLTAVSDVGKFQWVDG